MGRSAGAASGGAIRYGAWLWAGAALLVSLTGAAGARAQPMDPARVPPELRPWVPWVLDALGDELCPAVDGQAVCAWPGELELELGESGGEFRHHVVTDRAVRVALPGSKKQWPSGVEVDKEKAVVLDAGDRPAVLLPKGAHVVRGVFAWRALPEVLPLPADVARVSLTVDGRPVESPRRTEDGGVWLRAAGAGATEPEKLEIEVFRRVDDGVPLHVVTHLRLRVAGPARDIRLEGALLEGSVPLGLQSGLPARLDPSRALVVQVRAGEHEIELAAHYAKPPARLVLGQRRAPWPEQEIWVWAPDAKLRAVELTGVPDTDPARTNLPTEWRKLRAFAVQAPAALGLTTTRRGEPDPAPNELRLHRVLWLDLDGQGYTVRDHLEGRMSRSWRLDLLRGRLGRVSVSGDAEDAGDQLLTVDAATGKPGVELRTGAFGGDMGLVAEWRIDGATRELPAVGWSEHAQSVSTELRLPPGWQLLGASGVDEVPGGWLSSWNLFDVFLVLLVALATARLGRRSWGVVALLALVASHGEPDTPGYVWLALLGLMGLLEILPRGRWRTLARVAWLGTAAALVVMTVGFCVGQARAALFPQAADASVERRLVAGDEMNLRSSTVATTRNEIQAHADSEVAEEEGKSTRAKAGEARYALRGPAPAEAGLIPGVKDVAGKQAALRQDPQAVIQTGPGLPTWDWASWRLGWSGPVDRDHTFRLWLLSPPEAAALSILRAALMGLLAFLLLRRSRAGAEPPPRAPKAGAAPGARLAKGGAPAIGLAVAAATLLSGAVARAEVPSKEVLDDLKSRLLRKAECEPDCVAVSELRLSLAERQLLLRAEVHAGAIASYQLPGPASVWVPRAIGVDGKPSYAVALLSDGFLHLRLGPGRHEVELAGPVGADELTLTPGTPPHRVSVQAAGWEIDGLNEDGRGEGSLRLTRKAGPEPGGGESARADLGLAPWLEITRSIEVGVSWTVATTVRRVSPTGTPIVARLPLWPGEEVTQAGLLVDKGELVLSLGRDDKELGFRSSLRPREKLDLRATEGKPWSEIWTLRCGPVWHCSSAGLAPVEHQRAGRYEPVFRPWPGERIELAFRRPAPAEGQSLTIDEARLTLSPGTRLARARLEVRLRTSTGGMHALRLPAEAQIQGLAVDGEACPIPMDPREVSVSLRPGGQRVVVQWQQPGGLGLFFRAPEVEIGGQAANARLEIELPADRWLLWAGGPRWGPAVLFWAYLLLLVAAGLAAARLPHSPLRSWQWILLGLGLTQVPVVVALVVASWFFLLAYRKRWLVARPALYDLGQIGVAFWTLLFAICLVAAVYAGLALRPDMQVAGAGSTDTLLAWYADRLGGALPRPWVFSAPSWAWRLVMMAWALWLAFSLVRWLPWAWDAFATGGLWRSVPRKARPRPQAAGAAAPQPAQAAQGAQEPPPDPPGAGDVLGV